jgi:hypothetical protein
VSGFVPPSPIAATLYLLAEGIPLLTLAVALSIRPSATAGGRGGCSPWPSSAPAGWPGVVGSLGRAPSTPRRSGRSAAPASTCCRPTAFGEWPSTPCRPPRSSPVGSREVQTATPSSSCPRVALSAVGAPLVGDRLRPGSALPTTGELTGGARRALHHVAGGTEGQEPPKVNPLESEVRSGPR